MTARSFCVRCGMSSCPSIRVHGGVCPRAELDKPTAEWLDLLRDPDGAQRLARELAALSYNVRMLRRAGD